ncbi:uncharacterized protein [Dermacentor andersoni]|uniref:uncharacterized protein n=1 Tax=Dermacentor andersoni TaxID=34620 RepID=UPI002415F539|nr:uncharacterized protein LOC129380313 [Dermacentor andersoni]
MSDVSVEDAQIGKNRRLNFTLTIREPLDSNPTLQITITKATGDIAECHNSIGSCLNKLCGGTSTTEQYLGEEWNNTCPVPKITTRISAESVLTNSFQALVGVAPTTINMAFEVFNGGSSVGCESFDVYIRAADKDHERRKQRKPLKWGGH